MGDQSNNEEAEASLMLRNYRFRFADTMALKSAVELGIHDIIHRHGGLMSLSQIVAGLSDAPSPNITCVERIMRLLVRRKIFGAHHHPTLDGGERDTLYDLTFASKWLLRNREQSLVTKILFDGHPNMTAPLHYLSQCAREGGTTFKKAHGCEIWEYASVNPAFNKLYNEFVEFVAMATITGIIAGYKHGFESIGSLVDVGGGIGRSVFEIAKSYPHIKCINFDLSHVIATTPQYDGVTHVGGDMFHSLPPADVVFMKAIPEKTGKVILAEFIVKEEGNGILDDTVVYLDLLMALYGGRERTELQWKNLLQQAGFPRYNIITTPTFLSIIEAYPL